MEANMDIQGFTHLTINNPIRNKNTNQQVKFSFPNFDKQPVQKSSRNQTVSSTDQSMDFHTLTEEEIQGIKDKYDVENMTRSELDALIQELIDLKAAPENLRQDLYKCRADLKPRLWTGTESKDYKPSNKLALLQDTVDKHVDYCNRNNLSINNDLTMLQIKMLQIFESLKR